MIHAVDISRHAPPADHGLLFSHVDVAHLRGLLDRVLPDQGAITVQRDVEGKDHAWQRTSCEETVVILDGALRVYWDQGEKICGAGSVISVPAGAMRGSTALKGGATYLIASHTVNLPAHA